MRREEEGVWEGKKKKMSEVMRKERKRMYGKKNSVWGVSRVMMGRQEAVEKKKKEKEGESRGVGQMSRRERERDGRLAI